MRHPHRIVAAALVAAAVCGPLVGCVEVPDENDDRFPKREHELVPSVSREDGQIAAGQVTGDAPSQPIAFTHKRHVQVLGMECEFCHSEARKSIHAGVPPTQTCMNCHKYVRTDAPEIQRLHAFYESGEPIPWNKVHDLPDYVHFSHKRHVRAGVNCTECHGQVALMEGVRIGGEAAADPHAEGDDHAAPVEERVVGTMTREASLQMGWCLDCHASHPSVDENYGEMAHLRRAELKDCWTCHK